MPKKISDMAIEKAPSLPDRISLFQSKLAIASYAQGSITDYCHVLYKAVVHLGKLPDDFTQEDVDGYFQAMLPRILSVQGCSINSRIAASPTNFISGHYAEPSRHLPGLNSVMMPASLLH